MSNDNEENLNSMDFIKFSGITFNNNVLDIMNQAKRTKIDSDNIEEIVSSIDSWVNSVLHFLSEKIKKYQNIDSQIDDYENRQEMKDAIEDEQLIPFNMYKLLKTRDEVLNNVRSTEIMLLEFCKIWLQKFSQYSREIEGAKVTTQILQAEREQLNLYRDSIKELMENTMNGTRQTLEQTSTVFQSKIDIISEKMENKIKNHEEKMFNNVFKNFEEMFKNMTENTNKNSIKLFNSVFLMQQDLLSNLADKINLSSEQIEENKKKVKKMINDDLKESCQENFNKKPKMFDEDIDVSSKIEDMIQESNNDNPFEEKKEEPIKQEEVKQEEVKQEEEQIDFPKYEKSKPPKEKIVLPNKKRTIKKIFPFNKCLKNAHYEILEDDKIKCLFCGEELINLEEYKLHMDFTEHELPLE